MSAALNNFIKYSFTIRTPIQILYGFRTRKAFDLLRIKDFDLIISEITSKARTVTIIAYFVIIKSAIVGNGPSISRSKMSSLRIVIFVKSSIAIFYIKGSIFITFIETSFTATSHIVIINEYRLSHIDVKNAITFASLKIKKIYNTRHQPIFFKIGDLVNLRFYKNYKVSAITSKKIKSQLIKPFKILERIERLIYRMKLPANMKIHNVIFITHLKPVIDPAEDLYRKRRLSVSVVIVDDEKEYEIEKLLKKRIVKRGREWFVQYLI